MSDQCCSVADSALQVGHLPMQVADGLVRISDPQVRGRCWSMHVTSTAGARQRHLWCKSASRLVRQRYVSFRSPRLPMLVPASVARRRNPLVHITDAAGDGQRSVVVDRRCS
jgi:hypothetical protein